MIHCVCTLCTADVASVAVTLQHCLSGFVPSDAYAWIILVHGFQHGTGCDPRTSLQAPESGPPRRSPPEPTQRRRMGVTATPEGTPGVPGSRSPRLHDR